MRAPRELCGHEEHEDREQPSQRRLRQRVGRQDPELDARHRDRADDRGGTPSHVPIEMLAPRSGHDHRQDRQERRRFRVDLAEIEQQDERRHEDQPAADAEQAAERTCE
ncbi:MAG TPA: hypothetical protein VKC65_09115 [Gaiellaceae bacterium]|nr:hypothetical protein [Gaiellaceae bacterium]